MKKFIILLSFSLMIALAGVLNIQASDDDTYLSEEVQEACIKYGEEYGICPELIMAIVEHESSGRPNVRNGDCKGLMQVNENIHADRMERLGVTDIYSVDGNVHVGTDYLVELFEEYGDIYLVLMCYNMGPSRATELYEQGKYSKYALSVSARSEQLERLHGK